MDFRHSLIVGILGQYVDRFHEYQPHRSFEEKLKIAASIPGIQGIEVVYPQDFSDLQTSIKLIQDTGLPVSAVNLNVKGEKKWQAGSFTNSDPALRAQAVASMKEAMDLAAELDTDMITCCPLIDGWDYNFQVDYQKQWAWLIEGIREAALHRPDIRISLEYKPFEARNRIILPDVSTTLLACSQVDLPNVGVTMDVGHALGAGETPAASACLAYDAGRLFYVHFNDNNRHWDWDMVPGAVNIWDMLETLFYLDRVGWKGWFTYDVYTRHGDPAEAFAATIRIIDRFAELLDTIGREEIQSLIDEGVPARAFEKLILQVL